MEVGWKGRESEWEDCEIVIASDRWALLTDRITEFAPGSKVRSHGKGQSLAGLISNKTSAEWRSISPFIN